MSLCCFPGLGYDPYNGSSLSYVKETAPERELGIIYPGQAKEPKAKGKFPGQLGIVQGIPLEPEPGQKLLENQRASGELQFVENLFFLNKFIFLHLFYLFQSNFVPSKGTTKIIRW